MKFSAPFPNPQAVVSPRTSQTSCSLKFSVRVPASGFSFVNVCVLVHHHTESLMLLTQTVFSNLCLSAKSHGLANHRQTFAKGFALRWFSEMVVAHLSPICDTISRFIFLFKTVPFFQVRRVATHQSQLLANMRTRCRRHLSPVDPRSVADSCRSCDLVHELHHVHCGIQCIPRTRPFSVIWLGFAVWVVGCCTSGVISSALIVAMDHSASSSIDDGGSRACFEPAALWTPPPLTSLLLSVWLQLTTPVFVRRLHSASFGLPLLLPNLLDTFSTSITAALGLRSRRGCRTTKAAFSTSEECTHVLLDQCEEVVHPDSQTVFLQAKCHSWCSLFQSAVVKWVLSVEGEEQ